MQKGKNTQRDMHDDMQNNQENPTDVHRESKAKHQFRMRHSMMRMHTGKNCEQ